MSTSFFVKLPGSDYEDGLGWLCHPLSASGATLEELRIDGVVVSADMYWVNGPYVQLSDALAKRPPDALLKIQLAHREKLDVQVWVALIALTGTIGAALISAWTGKVDSGDKAQPQAASVILAPGPMTAPASIDHTTKPAMAGPSLPAPKPIAKPALRVGPATAITPQEPEIPSLQTYALALTLKEKGKYMEALQAFRLLGENGDKRAQYQVGIIYLGGLGVPASPEKAAIWLSRAAIAGVPEAEYNLAMMYRHGDGVEPNEAKAMQLLRSAAEKGLPEAQQALK